MQIKEIAPIITTWGEQKLRERQHIPEMKEWITNHPFGFRALLYQFNSLIDQTNTRTTDPKPIPSYLKNLQKLQKTLNLQQLPLLILQISTQNTEL